MKKFVLLCLIQILWLYGFSQEQSTKYKELKGYLQSKGYSISTEQYANLAQGGEATYVKTFYENTSYAIIAMSDDSDVIDVDVYLKYKNGTVYSKDTDAENVAIITFDPSYTRDMQVVIKNYSSRTPNYKSRCRFIIGYK